MEGPNAREQIVFCIFQWKSKWMLVMYMPRMRNNSLEIRIAGSSCYLQLTWVKKMLIWPVTSIGIEIMKIWIFDIIEMLNEETNAK